MKKRFKCIMILLLLFSLVGCSKETSQTDFMEFSAKCRAQEYYQICDKLAGDGKTYFYYNHNNDFFFETYTMLEKCECDSDTFKLIKNGVETEFNTNKIVSGYIINDIAYDIFFVENKNRLYGEFQEFGFIAFNEEYHYINFYWFYNQDYDMSIYDTASFDEFFKAHFSWLEA